MKLYYIFLVILSVFLIFSRLFGFFTVDYIVLLLFAFLCVPVAAVYLKSLKIFGAEFQFKETIEETMKFVEQSKVRAKARLNEVIEGHGESVKPVGIKSAEKVGMPKIHSANKKSTPLLGVFDLSLTKELLEKDPVLALANLRIEVESKLRVALAVVSKVEKERLSLSLIIHELKKNGWLHREQVEALKRIITMCNKAIHGYKITKSNAEKIVDIADELNKTFSVGLIPNFSSNDNYDAQGLLCKWEHCIELMPLPQENSNKACPVFGHECPGGLGQVVKCDKTIDDFPRNRYNE